MSLRSTPLNCGRLLGTVYDFGEVGDVLPMHAHDETTVHITVIARGSFHAHGDGWECHFGVGEIVDWQPHDPHEFTALVPNSRLVNIIKG
jgi:hypothetical protein